VGTVRELNHNVFPNPGSGTFTFIFQPELKDVWIDVTNLLGEKICAMNLRYGNSSINIRNQPNGIYFYTLINQGEEIKTGKIVLLD